MDRRSWIESPKVVYHEKWLRRWRKDPFSVMPIYIEVSPVGMCNHRCTFCAPEMLGYPNRSLSVEVMGKFLRELKELRERDPDGLGVKSIQYAGEGEPTLHKNLAEIFQLTREAGIDIGMLTNATGLTERLANQIIPLVNGYIQVSINAGTEASYAKIHRTSPNHWGMVWRNIERAVKIREKVGAANCDLGVNMTVLTEGSVESDGTKIPPNWPEIELLVKRAKESGVDYISVKPYSQHLFSQETARHYGTMSYKEVMDEIFHTGDILKEQYNSDDFEVVFRFSRFEEYEAEDRGYTTCRATPTVWSYIQSDGLWLSCSAYWTDPRFALGDINRQSVREIWFGEARRKHMKFVLCELDITECRKTCHPDKENRLFDQIADMSDSEFESVLAEFRTTPVPKRVNFI